MGGVGGRTVVATALTDTGGCISAPPPSLPTKPAATLATESKHGDTTTEAVQRRASSSTNTRVTLLWMRRTTPHRI